MKKHDRPHRPTWLALLLTLLMLATAATLGISADAASSGGNGNLFLPFVRSPMGLQGDYFSGGFPGYLTTITHRNTERLFVTERRGRIWIVQGDGTVIPSRSWTSPIASSPASSSRACSAWPSTRTTPPMDSST